MKLIFITLLFVSLAVFVNGQREVSEEIKENFNNEILPQIIEKEGKDFQYDFHLDEIEYSHWVAAGCQVSHKIEFHFSLESNRIFRNGFPKKLICNAWVSDTISGM